METYYLPGTCPTNMGIDLLEFAGVDDYHEHGEYAVERQEDLGPALKRRAAAGSRGPALRDAVGGFPEKTARGGKGARRGHSVEPPAGGGRSEEHTSEIQSLRHL